MTHPTLRPLIVLREQAEQDRDQALARQLRAEQAWRAAQNQQLQLQDYRQDYQRRWGQQLGQGMAVSLMHCYHDFIERLHGVVEMQGDQVTRLQQAYEHAREATVAAELRVSSVERLIERRQAGLLRVEEQRDQKRQDEFAARLSWQRRQDGGFGLSQL